MWALVIENPLVDGCRNPTHFPCFGVHRHRRVEYSEVKIRLGSNELTNASCTCAVNFSSPNSASHRTCFLQALDVRILLSFFFWGGGDFLGSDHFGGNLRGFERISIYPEQAGTAPRCGGTSAGNAWDPNPKGRSSWHGGLDRSAFGSLPPSSWTLNTFWV